MSARFEIKRSSNQKFYFCLKAVNGETILRSELYERRQGAENGIQSVITHSSDDFRYDRLKSNDDHYYFNLKAANGEIIGTSEMYETRQGMENGIDSVKRNAVKAALVDLSQKG
jgi:uncharacterized protein YegP (UPF0339 family)